MSAPHVSQDVVVSLCIVIPRESRCPSSLFHERGYVENLSRSEESSREIVQKDSRSQEHKNEERMFISFRDDLSFFLLVSGMMSVPSVVSQETTYTQHAKGSNA